VAHQEKLNEKRTTAKRFMTIEKKLITVLVRGALRVIKQKKYSAPNLLA
jgi:hypothetical protein